MKPYYIIGVLVFLQFAFFQANAQRKMERMDRGIVAMPKSASQVYISWRHFATDPDGIAYNLYYKTSESGAHRQQYQFHSQPQHIDFCLYLSGKKRVPGGRKGRTGQFYPSTEHHRQPHCARLQFPPLASRPSKHDDEILLACRPERRRTV